MLNDHQHTNEQLGDYQLLHLLGHTSHTEVYFGEHIHQHTPVAIKLMKERGAVNEVTQFLKRARSLIHLRHPHIVPILDFGVRDGNVYLVMNYVPNGHLRQRHPKGSRVPLATILGYVKQITDGLHYVHQHNFIHRDIKPHNMLLGANNEIMLSDFGIAIASQSIDPLQAAIYDFEGTVPYAAPEQLQGKPRRSSDQYSLGVVVYEWLCGDWPFSGSFDEITHQHLFVPAPPLQQKGIELPSLVEQVIMKTLEKEPEKRFQDVETFAEALERASHLTGTYPIPAEATPQQSLKSQFLSPLPFPKKHI